MNKIRSIFSQFKFLDIPVGLMTFEVCRPKLKHCTKAVTVVDSHISMLINDRFISELFIKLMAVKVPLYWITITVNLEMVGRGNTNIGFFFLGGRFCFFSGRS